jgi:hypothetical protein
MVMEMKMKKILALLLVMFLLYGGIVLAQEQVQTPSERLVPPVSVIPEVPAEEEGPLSLSATGRVSWLVKYGLGDPRGLTERGMPIRSCWSRPSPSMPRGRPDRVATRRGPLPLRPPR